MKTSFAHLEKGRSLTGQYASKEGDRTGEFVVRISEDTILHMIADCGSMSGWEHVIISRVQKTGEGIVMNLLDIATIAMVKEMFWDDNETVAIFISEDAPTLTNSPLVHLWKSKRQQYILPKSELFTPSQKPDNVIPLPIPSPEQKTP